MGFLKSFVSFKMLMVITLILFSSLVSVSFLEQNYDEVEKLGCSLDWIISCAGEVTNVWEKCQNNAEIMKCINEALGDSECCSCLCETLEWIGLVDWDTCVDLCPDSCCIQLGQNI